MHLRATAIWNNPRLYRTPPKYTEFRGKQHISQYHKSMDPVVERWSSKFTDTKTLNKYLHNTMDYREKLLFWCNIPNDLFWKRASAFIEKKQTATLVRYFVFCARSLS